jgi:hypothetical protein
MLDYTIFIVYLLMAVGVGVHALENSIFSLYIKNK